MPTKGRTMRFKKASALLIALAVVGVLAILLPVPGIMYNLMGYRAGVEEGDRRVFSLASSALLGIVGAAVIVLGVVPALAFGWARPVTDLILGGDTSIIMVSGWGFGTSGVFYYSAASGTTLAVVVLAILLASLSRRATRGAEVFNGGEAAVEHETESAWFVRLAPSGYQRPALIVRYLVDPQAMYSIVSGVWLRLTFVVGVALRVIEDRYYIGAVFLLILGVALLVLQ